MRAVIILADAVYSIPLSKVSLVELIRHNCNDSENLSFRFIKGNNCSDLSVSLTEQIEDLYSLRKRCSSGIAYVLCGLEECSTGYSIPLFSTHVNGIVSELNKIKYDVTFVNCKITNGLKGKIGGWVSRSSTVIAETCLERNCDEIVPKITLKVHGDFPVIAVDATRDIVSEICYHIEDEEFSED